MSDRFCQIYRYGCPQLEACSKVDRCLQLQEKYGVELDRLVSRHDPPDVLAESRVVVSDDNKQISITFYGVPITPRRALQLAKELLEAGLRGLERTK